MASKRHKGELPVDLKTKKSMIAQKVVMASKKKKKRK